MLSRSRRGTTRLLTRFGAALKSLLSLCMLVGDSTRDSNSLIERLSESGGRARAKADAEADTCARSPLTCVAVERSAERLRAIRKQNGDTDERRG